LPDQTTGSRRRRDLARRLKEAREDVGLSGRALAAELGWSQAKVSRGERGETMLPLADIGRWLRHCRVDDDEITRLLEIAEEATVEAVANRHLNRWGHANHQRDRIDREASARSIEVYQTEVIPGLFQTRDYTRDLLLAIGSATPDTVDESVAARQERQNAVTEADVQLHAVITEQALKWQPSSAEVSRKQLDRLTELSALPHVRIGVISADAQRHVLTSNSFVLIRWPDGAAEVETESLTDETTISDPADVNVYADMFKLQSEHAVYGPEAEAIIQTVRRAVD
jgi:transcriptional regulator with XRE-family HTH domain